MKEKIKTITLGVLIGAFVVPTIAFGGGFVSSLIQGKTAEEAVQILASQINSLVGRVEQVEQRQQITQAQFDFERARLEAEAVRIGVETKKVQAEIERLRKETEEKKTEAGGVIQEQARIKAEQERQRLALVQLETMGACNDYNRTLAGIRDFCHNYPRSGIGGCIWYYSFLYFLYSDPIVVAGHVSAGNRTKIYWKQEAERVLGILNKLKELQAQHLNAAKGCGISLEGEDQRSEKWISESACHFLVRDSNAQKKPVYIWLKKYCGEDRLMKLKNEKAKLEAEAAKVRAEQERQRQKEIARQQELERQRQSEIQRQRELEAQRLAEEQRQREIVRQQELEEQDSNRY